LQPCHFLRLKCTKFNIDWGSPNPPGNLQRSADPLAGLRVLTFKGRGREWVGNERVSEEEGMWKERKGRREK